MLISKAIILIPIVVLRHLMQRPDHRLIDSFQEPVDGIGRFRAEFALHEKRNQYGCERNYQESIYNQNKCFGIGQRMKKFSFLAAE